MTRALAWACLVAACTTACALDPHRNKRPARLQLGAAARGFGATEVPQVAARGGPVMMTPLAREEAFSATAQFTMRAMRNFYLGGELEAGMLSAAGSNYAGGYGVFGADLSTGNATLGAELAGGYRTMRYGFGEPEVDDIVFEPRVRGQVQIGPQLSFGGVLGTTLGDHGMWMAGFYLGVHSHGFGAR